MVHEGGPSKGCDTCRLRKVKCTEEKPFCLRCQKGGFVCLGYYRRPWAVLKQKSSEIQRGRTTRRQIDSSSESSQSSSDKSSVLETKISPLPAWSWEDRSVNFFLDQFVVLPEKGQNIGWFEFVPELLTNAEPCSPLEFAFRAVSCLSLANRYNRSDLRLMALGFNGGALNAINEALKSPLDAAKDTTFAAILLLCFFGHINGDLRLQISAHAIGMYRLLGLRSKVGMQSAHQESLTRHFFALMHLENNDTYVSESTPTNDQMQFPDIMPQSPSLFTRLGMIWPVSASLMLELKQLIAENRAASETTRILELSETAKSLDEQVQETVQGLDPIWYYDTVLARNARPGSSWTKDFRKVLIYHDAWVMGMWHAYRITRISLQSVLITCYEILSNAGYGDRDPAFEENSQELCRQSMAIIDEMNEDICTSIPWALGHLDGFQRGQKAGLAKASRASLSIVGLKTVVSGRFTRQLHSTQASVALREIADRFGIKGALL